MPRSLMKKKEKKADEAWKWDQMKSRKRTIENLGMFFGVILSDTINVYQFDPICTNFLHLITII